MPRRPGRWLGVGAIVAGAALALASLDGVAFAAGQGATVRDPSSAAGLVTAQDPVGAGVGVAAKPDKPDKRRGDDHSGNGAGLGRLVHGGLDDGQADDLADELDDCLTDGNVEDMRLGQIKRLAHAAGLKTQDLKELLAEDDDSHPGRGLGRLVRDGLDDDQAEDLADELRERLEAGDLEDLRLGKILQAAHACGITTDELKDLLGDD